MKNVFQNQPGEVIEFRRVIAILGSMTQLMFFVFKCVLGVLLLGLQIQGKTIWRLGIDDLSGNEFGKKKPDRYAIPADWGDQQDWSDFVWKLDGNHPNPVIDLEYSLSSVPEHGVEFSFRSLKSTAYIPAVALFSNGQMAGLIQTFGLAGTSIKDLYYRRIYRLYVPKEMLKPGVNTLRLEMTLPLFAPNNGMHYLFWDYLKLDALEKPATEAIHGAKVYAGGIITQDGKGKGQFVIDEYSVSHARTLLHWMGIAYSQNVMRANFWENIAKVQTHRDELLEVYRQMNMAVVADFKELQHMTEVDEQGNLSAQDKTDVDEFLKTYADRFQFIEISNEPGHIGPVPKEHVIAYARYLREVQPRLASHVKLVSPGWAFNDWAAEVKNRQQIEQFADYLGGHSYGSSYRDPDGGSFIETLKSTGSVDNGFTKPLFVTEYGSNDWHFANDKGATQKNALAFDRNMRAHIAAARVFMQHASHFKAHRKTENFSLFQPIDWPAHNPIQSKAHPGVDGQDSRLKSYRRLALAYCTHGSPLEYTYLNDITYKRVYFRAVDTSALDSLPGSGARSDKTLLNFVNFSNQNQVMQVRVRMPKQGSFYGIRIGEGSVFDKARTVIKLEATPYVELEVSLPPRDAVQYIVSQEKDWHLERQPAATQPAKDIPVDDSSYL
ncbi:MAG: hypothetical protein AAF558_08720 [Verrucomicrobiota bacterium]